jgi:hypothetical protein
VRLGKVMPLFVAIGALAVGPETALGQANLDAGKSPAQIFSMTCAACHRSPRELRPTSASYLREHYSTGSREAAAMAGYLSAVGSDVRAVQQRRPPVLGAGSLGENPKGAQGAVEGRPRRPSDSLEIGRLPLNTVPLEGVSPLAHTASVPAPPQGAADIFEE